VVDVFVEQVVGAESADPAGRRVIYERRANGSANQMDCRGGTLISTTPGCCEWPTPQEAGLPCSSPRPTPGHAITVYSGLPDEPDDFGTLLDENIMTQLEETRPMPSGS
jgi:hypothetical protein